MKKIHTVSAACMLALMAGSASAQLMSVDQDLGTIGFGSYSLTGSTTGAVGGVAQAYNSANTLQVFRTYNTQEYVYQFTTTEEARFRLTNNLSDLGADNDYTILDNLLTAPEALDTGIWELAIGGLAWVDGDFGVPTEFFEGIFPAGTYYLAIDEFTGGDGSLVPGFGGPFDLVLEIIENVPPSPPSVFTDLGEIGTNTAAIVLETCVVSDFDTEMGLWDANGVLLANNDDACSLQSRITQLLPQGEYWFSVSGFNSTFANGWEITGSLAAGGTAGGLAGNSSFGPQVVNPTEIAWFKFTVGDGGTPPPPTSIDLGILGGSGSYDINTFGSTFDTELGLYDADGNLIANNDDAGGDLQSQVISNLSEGNYYIALGGWNTAFGSTFWSVTPGNASGDYLLSVNNNVVSSGFHPGGTVTWFTFEVSDSGPGECLGDIADDFGFTVNEGGGPDGQVEFGDFVALLGLIGPCDGGVPGCLGDIADDFGFTVNEGGGPDGQVEFGDFVALLGLIGPCP